ncbi:MAG: glycosyltransferase family 2 protein [Fimbriimonadaceae bacterium]|nr:glycosyltransferase family 2 protein [Fimbriimonadaceae bacterium]
MIDPTETAVMLIVFNRPEHTRQVFERIREARPKRLYVSADGPRPDRPDDVASIAATRKVALDVDWPCEVKTLLREQNLGCKTAIKTGLDWFFAQEEDGIILEDDCVPDPTFFRFAAEMLEKYRGDDRIATIAGTNYLLGSQQFEDSYYFTKYLFVWGWASWRRVWQDYDFEIKRWPKFRDEGRLHQVFPHPRSLRYWTWIFDRTYDETLNAYDYQFFFSQLINHRMSIVPARNLISNIGWGSGSTNTAHKNPEMGMETFPMPFPLRHPEFMAPDERADTYTEHLMFAKPFHRKVRNRLRRIVARWGGQ